MLLHFLNRFTFDFHRIEIINRMGRPEYLIRSHCLLCDTKIPVSPIKIYSASIDHGVKRQKIKPVLTKVKTACNQGSSFFSGTYVT
jgi:hypothetical protein